MTNWEQQASKLANLHGVLQRENEQLRELNDQLKRHVNNLTVLNQHYLKTLAKYEPERYKPMIDNILLN